MSQSAWVYVNLETGEWRDSVSTECRNKAFRERKAKESARGRRGEFTNANMRHLHEVYSVLTTPQCGYLMLLQCYIGWDDGIIENPDGSAMTTDDMRNVLGLTGTKKSTFYDFLTACLDNDIIREIDEKYAINERYHFKGALADTYAIKTYAAKLRRVYREVKANDIGLIYRMLPFVHMSTNALCADPFEKDPKKIRWFTQKELAEAIGVDERTLRRRLPLMKFDGEYVIARIKVGNEPERYTFNPSVFYRQDNEPDKTLVAMFEVKRK